MMRTSELNSSATTINSSLYCGKKTGKMPAIIAVFFAEAMTQRNYPMHGLTVYFQRALNLVRVLGGGIYCLTSLTLCLQAHHVWLEPTDTEHLVMRFGEGSGDVEASPGYLDNFSAYRSWMPHSKGEQAFIEMRKERDGFLLVGAKTDQPAVLEIRYAVYGQEEPTLPWYFARWHVPGTQAASQETTLDLIPLEGDGQVRAVFFGEPLANVKGQLLSLNSDEEQEIQADDAGVFHIQEKPPGLYQLIVYHLEERSGYALGKPYMRVAYNATLTWEQLAEE